MINYLKKILFILLFINGLSVSSQNQITSDTSSIISFTDKIIIKSNFVDNTYAFYVKDKTNNQTTKLTPNSEMNLLLSLDYEFIGLSIGFSPKFLPGNDDDSLKGKSYYTDFNFRFLIGKWAQRMLYNKVKGYYIENTQDFNLNWNKGRDPYLQLPNLTYIRWGGSTSYLVNPNFSIRNVTYQTEWQTKSAGSFLPGLFYSYNTIKNNVENIEYVENIFDLQIEASYYYTLVIHKNWFISSSLAPSLGVLFSNYTESSNGISFNKKTQHLIKTLDGELQLGYGSRKVVFGASVNVEINWFNEDKITHVIEDKIHAKIYLGYRFGSPKIVQKPFKWVNKKMGIE
jgi:hypothetical protein